tara:strand:+ start:1625 stop:2230 length:606 start_codon:yes stop_codon:yes gene_type:complete
MPAGMHEGMKSSKVSGSAPKGGGADMSTVRDSKGQRNENLAIRANNAQTLSGIENLVRQQNADKREEKFEVFRAKPYSTQMVKFPGITGLVLNMLQGPLKANSVYNRDFFMNRVAPYQNIDFASLNPTQQEQMYKDYMAQRLSGQTDAMGRPINNFGNDGGGGIAEIPQEPLIQPVDNTGINQLNPYVKGGEFIYGIPTGV